LLIFLLWKLIKNRQQIKQAFLSGKIKAICDYPGIGKTYLEGHCIGFEDGWFSEHFYSDKANGIKNDNFPENYIETVTKIIERDKIVLTAMSVQARQVFKYLDLPYLLIYPSPIEKKRYFDIYDTRPDAREWIGLNKSVWDKKIQNIEDVDVPEECYKDEIPVGMNLTDYLKELDVIRNWDSIFYERRKELQSY